MRFRVVIQKEGAPKEVRMMEGESRFDIYSRVHAEGGVVTLIDERPPVLGLPNLQSITFGTGVKMDERISFAKNLAAMLSAGLPLFRALSVIARQTRNKALKSIVDDLVNDVKKGSGFHEGLARHPKVFSQLFISMTKAGEESGKLSETLHVVAQQMERSHNLTKKIRGAMMYPSIILFAIVVIGALLFIYVVPTLSSTFASLGADLPLATRIIIAISNFMAAHVLLVFAGFGFFLFAGILFVRSKPGSKLVLMAALHLPTISDLVRETYAARAARSLASLLSSGVEMLSAIDIAREVVGDNVFGAVLAEAGQRVKKGETLSSAFASHSTLFPFFITDMISVGEETGKVADMLGQVAEYYESDVEDRTKDLSTIIEPILMLVIGAAVGVFAIAMISPIYSLSSQI